ncbi:MAG: zf-HC2 domain-containing protein [Calditrichaceae bacterium]|nr:zf-HC2 domain-containing protein [Calditrichaceae bacterium]
MSKVKPACEEMRVLMMGLMDNELDASQKKKVLEHLVSCEECAKQYDAFNHLKKETSEMKFKKLPEMYWDEYWDYVYNKLERGIAWIILSLGAIMIFSYGAYEMTYEFFFDETISLFLRISTGIFTFGIIVLTVSVLREKLMIRHIDKYRSIKR